mgnify:FL=1
MTCHRLRSRRRRDTECDTESVVIGTEWRKIWEIERAWGRGPDCCNAFLFNRLANVFQPRPGLGASASGAEGYRFESCRGYFEFRPVQIDAGRLRRVQIGA